MDSILGARDLGANNKTPDCSQRLYSVLLVQGGFDFHYTGESMEVSNFMEAIFHSAQQRSSVSRQLIPTGNNKVISTDTTVKDRGGKKWDADHLFDMLPDLVNPTFKAWYCKMFYALGKDRVLQLASLARQDGKDNRKYFSHLLKKAV